MQNVSQAFLDSLDGSTKPRFKMDVWRDGVLLAEDVPFSDGSLTITAGQAIRSRLTASITDTEGDLAPTRLDSPLAPYGSEVNVQAGLLLGQQVELVSLGWFPLVQADTEEMWTPYSRPDEPGRIYRVTRGRTTPIEGADRSQLVSEDRFQVATQPSKPTVLAEIAYLLRGVIPWKAPNGFPDARVPKNVTYQDDRLAAVQTLADVVNAEFVIGPDGVGTLQLSALTDPVWTVGSFTKASMKRSLSRDGMYNGVIYRGQTSDQRVIQGSAVITSGPLAWNGPFGRVPYFASSDFLDTQAKVNAAARTRLANLVAGRTQEVLVETKANFALETGDTVLLETPNGSTPARVTEIAWRLGPGSMNLKLAVNPDDLGTVKRPPTYRNPALMATIQVSQVQVSIS